MVDGQPGEGEGMNATASATIRNGRTAVIQAATEIRRPAEVVFGYCSDHANEIEWNPEMRRVAKISDGPVGVGTRYEMEFFPGVPWWGSACGSTRRPRGRWPAR